MKHKSLIVLLFIFCAFTLTAAQEDTAPADTVQADSILPPAPVSMLTAKDSENDH